MTKTRRMLAVRTFCFVTMSVLILWFSSPGKVGIEMVIFPSFLLVVMLWSGKRTLQKTRGNLRLLNSN